MVLVKELGWVDDNYLESILPHPLDQIVTIVGRDSKGRRWLRICLGWFFHADTGMEYATYWDYWINDLGEVILRLQGAEAIEFPLIEARTSDCRSRRFTAWNFSGKPCNVCGFRGAMLYREVCKMCLGSLIFCPKCGHIDCYGTKADDFPRLRWWEV